MITSATDFEQTSFGLDRGLQVEHIATFPLITCDQRADAERVLNSDMFSDFDQIPVDAHGEISGVLIRSDTSYRGPVEESPLYRPLRGSMLISSALTLSACVPLLGERGSFRLVIRNDKVDGIVTPSDLLKLPVRLLAFSKITHLEMLMRESLIDKCTSHDAWMSELSESRRDKIQKKKLGLASSRLDPLGLDLTDFCDKRDLIKKLGIIPVNSKRTFELEIKAIEDLRNKIAHASDYADDREDLTTFIDTMRLLDKWIINLGSDIRRLAPN